MAAEKPHPLQILCVDDHTLVGDALATLFTSAGYAVERAADGEMAWMKVSADLARFDVLITDQQLPRLSGLRLIERLRTTDFRGRVIVYSGRLTADEIAALQRLGVDAIIAKEPDAARLLAVVEAFNAKS